ncbi:MAG: hypothetical protein ACK5R0_06790, partial [Bacteroidota bacterium]
MKNNFREVFFSGVKVGSLASIFCLIYQVIKYIFEYPFLFTPLADLIFSTLFLTFIVVLILKLQIRFDSRYENFFVAITSCLVASILVCGSLIALHHTLDTDFKERISDVKIELIREKTAKLEKRIKGNVISSIDFEQIRKDEIEK